MVDPEDLTSLESAAGDFSAVGENGETLQLESSGMVLICCYIYIICVVILFLNCALSYKLRHDI